MFDLNIENYKREELEEIFELPNNYSLDMIEINETNLRKSIESNSEIDQNLKIKTTLFLTKAKNILSSHSLINSRGEPKDVFNRDTNILKKSEINSNSGESFLIERKQTTPYLNAEASNYFPGTINPLNKRITRKHLNIDTRFRNNYTLTSSTNFNFDLPIKLSNVVSMQLESFELPYNIYSISSCLGNNYFWVSDSCQNSLRFVVPDGNYASADLISFLNSIVQDTTAEITIPSGDKTVLISNTVLKYLQFSLEIHVSDSGTSSGLGKTSIACVDPSGNFYGFTLDLTRGFGGGDDGTSLPLKLGWKMGFRNGVYENGSLALSEGVLNMLGPRYLFLVVDEYSNSVNDNFYSAFTDSLLNKNILARLTTNVGNFEYISQNNLITTTSPREYFGPIDIQNLKIQLLDEYGRIIKLNSMDYSFCLTFECIYNL